jgi:hypothetical protein
MDQLALASRRRTAGADRTGLPNDASMSGRRRSLRGERDVIITSTDFLDWNPRANL